MQQNIVKNLLKTFDQAGLWEDGKERGFTINLPNPRDYCLHKLIMGQRRKHAAKRLKDIEHAVYVLPILNSDDVAHPVAAYPPKWRKLIKDSLRQAVAQIPEEIPTINKSLRHLEQTSGK